MNLNRRLLLLMLPALGLLLFGGGVIDYVVTRGITRGAEDRILASSAQTLGLFVRDQDGQLLWRPPADALPDTRLFAILDAAGHLIAGDAALAVTPARPTGSGPIYFDLQARTPPLRVVRALRQTDAGPVAIYFAQNLQKRERAEHAMLFAKLSVDFIELDLALLLIWIAVYLGLRPLRQLQDAVEARTIREMEVFNEGKVPGEVRPLVRAFNRLLELLRDAAAAQQRFVANAAHQLRTPIAGLSAQLELLLRNPATASMAAELSSVSGGIARVAHSANQLLSLARTEQVSVQSEHFETVALRPMLEEIIGRHIDRAVSLGLDLGAELDDATMQGDIWMLQDLSTNLLDNALKYTPRGGHVTMRCGCTAEGAPYIEVEDDGPGIPEAERRHVRERFHRGTSSVTSGCGLGLAIVEEIARVHLGQLTIHSGAGGAGVRMSVCFTPVL